jgi:hypothetical protein
MDQQPIGVDKDGRPVYGLDAQGQPVYQPVTAQTKAPSANEAMLSASLRPMFGQTGAEFGVGATKGAAHTFLTLGELVHKIPGVRQAIDAFYGEPGLSARMFGEADAALEPTNAAQSAGRFLEQSAEVAVPASMAMRGVTTLAKLVPYAAGRAAVNVAGSAATGGALAAAQGNDPVTGAVIGGAVPIVVAGAAATGRGLVDLGNRMATSAVKPTITALKQEANASREGLDAISKRLVKFIVDRGLTTPQKAQAIVDDAEREIRSVFQGKNAVTDAGERAVRYLRAVGRSASKQAIPADDISALKSEMSKFMESSPLTETVVVKDAAGKILVDRAGNPITMRVPRTDVMADEALATGRATSKWSTRRQWGEQKGTGIEANKAAERATRDAAKNAVPELKPILRNEGLAIKARELLNRMAVREGNRDVLGLPQVVAAAPALASGQVPKFGLVMQFYRQNQLRLGIMGDRLGKAIKNMDGQEVERVLGQIVAANAPAPMASHAAVPPVVETPSVLSGAGPGIHTLSDGSVWKVDESGAASKVR